MRSNIYKKKYIEVDINRIRENTYKKKYIYKKTYRRRYIQKEYTDRNKHGWGYTQIENK